MKRTLILSTFVAGLVTWTLPLAAHAELQTFQAKDMVVFMAGSPTSSAATLLRTKHGVQASVAASGLEPDSAYTVWFAVFNNPAACLDGCDPSDFDRARGTLLNATGFVTGSSGEANFTASLEAGEPALGRFIRAGNGVLETSNGFGAEVHVVIRGHGPIIPGSVSAQTSTFDGGCDVNSCANLQAAVFPAVE